MALKHTIGCKIPESVSQRIDIQVQSGKAKNRSEYALTAVLKKLSCDESKDLNPEPAEVSQIKSLDLQRNMTKTTHHADINNRMALGYPFENALSASGSISRLVYLGVMLLSNSNRSFQS